MTSPRCPVMVNCLPPRMRVASMKMMSPPTGVQTSPTATPGLLTRSSTSFSVRNFGTPRNSRTTSGVTTIFSILPSAMRRACLRVIVAISRSRLRTPASRVKLWMISCKPSFVNSICSPTVRPCSLACLGIRYLCAMCSFSSPVYPGNSMISMRSRNGSGMRRMHTAKSDAHELAPQRTRDGLAKRRLAHARRAHEAKNRSLHSRLKLLHRQVIEDALLHLLQIVVVLVENLVRLHDVDFRAARGLAPRQRSHPFQICPRNHVLRGSRSHFRQPLQLAFALFLGFRGHAGFFRSEEHTSELQS